jgi:hypothetical membrane protein
MKYIIAGSLLWILSVQYFIVQILVAGAYDGQFSLAHNTISDLGNTACAMYGDRFVCSPWHILMNGSFILLGLTQLLGAAMFYFSNKSRRNLIGFGFLMLAGIGTIIVGLYPENAPGPMHAFGAALPFVLGNIAMLVLSARAGFPTWMRYYSLLSGSIGLTALILFMTKNYLGIGLGGMERVVAYPQTIWMIIVGISYLLGRNRKV